MACNKNPPSIDLDGIILPQADKLKTDTLESPTHLDTHPKRESVTFTEPGNHEAATKPLDHKRIGC